MNVQVKTLGNNRDLVGESPFWDQRSGQLYWVDIVGKAIRQLNIETGALHSWNTSDFPTAISLSNNHGKALVSFASGVCRFNLQTGVSTPFAAPEIDNPHMRLNEGKCDPSGRFWSSSMDNNLNPDGSSLQMRAACGRLFRIDRKSKIKQFGGADLGIPNTMAWSPDRTKFYFADTLLNTIWVYDYDDRDGDISNRRVFVEGGPGLPDGSCVDSEGYLWNARFSAGKVLRFSPTGQLEVEIDVPCTNPTDCTFGTSDLKTLFVTSGKFGLSGEDIEKNPNEGGLFSFRTEVSGQNENYFFD